MEKCLSGLKSLIANRVYSLKIPRVQIPSSPLKKVILFAFIAVILLVVFKILFLSTFENSHENSSDVVEVEEAQPNPPVPLNCERVKNEIKSIQGDPQKVVYVLIRFTVVRFIIISVLQIYAFGIRAGAIALQWRIWNTMDAQEDSHWPT